MRKNEIDALNKDLAVLEDQMANLNRQRDEILKNIVKKQIILAEKAVFSYKYGSNDVAKYIITARDINEIVNNLYLFKNIMENEADMIEDLRYEKEEFERINRKSIEKKEEIEATMANIEDEKAKLEKDIAENKVLLDQVKGEKSEMQNLLNEIKARIAQVQPPGLTLVGEWEMVATAYYAYGRGGNDINGDGITAIGLRARKGIVAVDPGVIPLGTRLFIPGYGEALAADTGGWIKNNRIDLCFETLQECYGYGRRKIRIYLVE
ncbi:MAG: hypothetical protein JW770_03945 [Actinobacteria bacterium]|nr:hypothetical protein [Actinomycetota bacterium]